MKKFLQLVRGVDKFGHAVNVNYRGSGHFKTLFGVVATLLNVVFILNFSTTKLINMYTRQSKQITSLKTYVDLQESEERNLFQEKLQIGYITALGSDEINDDVTSTLDPRFGSIIASQVEFSNYWLLYFSDRNLNVLPQ